MLRKRWSSSRHRYINSRSTNERVDSVIVSYFLFFFQSYTGYNCEPRLCAFTEPQTCALGRWSLCISPKRREWPPCARSTRHTHTIGQLIDVHTRRCMSLETHCANRGAAAKCRKARSVGLRWSCFASLFHTDSPYTRRSDF